MTTLFTRSGYALPCTTLNYKTGTWRVQRPVHQRRPAPCHSGCPAGEDGQAYLAKVAEGDWQGAWMTLVAVNPLPGTTGRVCHHPCEDACNRGQYDQPIAIHAVERFLGDEAIRHGWAYPATRPAPDAPRIAIVGSGPAGLAAAYHLIRRGINVTLFEAMPAAGGLLRMAIPPYRLPRNILDAELERLLAVGIDFQPRRKLGRDMSLDELRADYPAVFLGVGSQLSREWNVDGVVPRDLHQGLDLLKDWISVGAIPVPKSAAIVGGGNTAVDIARVLRLAGAREVHIITHNQIPAPHVPSANAMTAIPREIQLALEEGIVIHEYRGIRRLILRGERVVGLELVHMKKLPREGGRMGRVAFEGTETVLHVDQVIPAIGQEVDPEGVEQLLNGASYLRADGWGQIAGHPGLFTGGDARGDRGSVTEAIGDGRRAAEGIAKYLRGDALPAVEAEEPIPYQALNLHYFERAPRVTEPVLPLEKRDGAAEVELSLSRDEVKSESLRCFSCGSCLACDNCWTLCPDMAVLKTQEVASGGAHYVFDYDYCKGCGLCAHECPSGYIAMAEEV
ncbi:MAG: FAD-dependent oxidoreductase [Gammaproteobacteria bacterium]